MDNLATHKVAGVAEAIRGRDAGLVCMPAYRPDLNPIGPAFAKRQGLARTRTAAERPPSVVRKLIRGLTRRLRPDERRTDIRHSGYPAMKT